MGLLDWILGRTTADARPTDHAAESCGVAVLDAPRDAAEPAPPEAGAPWWQPEEAGPTELVEPTRPNLSLEARAFEELLISYFDGHDLRLPPLVDTAERILPLLHDRKCDARRIAAALSQDQVMTAAVLRMANSPLYRGVNPITALQPAITRLGTRALQTLLMHESFRAATFTRRDDDRGVAQYIWRKSLVSGCVMRRLAELMRTDPEDAYLTGLMHDIGEVVVLRIARDQRHRGTRQLDLDTDTFVYLCHETHQEFGELVADAWSLPEELKAVIADHHSYPAPDDALRTKRLQLHLTDMINALSGYAPYVPYDLLRSRAATDLRLAERQDFVSMLHRLPEEIDEVVELL